MSGRTPRRLTQAEARLWRSVALSMRRLRADGEVPHEPPAMPAVPAPAPAAQTLSSGAPPRGTLPPRATSPQWPPARRAPAVDLASDPLAEAAAAPARIDRRRFDRMMRGKLVPEARLDLHGMTRLDAQAALIRFVLDAQARGLRLVLVITGKGRPDRGDTVIPERQGVLRHSLPHWLGAPPLTGRVLEMRPAHPRHGGAGAVYLYLRRRA